PVLFELPRDAPEDRVLAAIDRAQDEREVEAEGEPGEVEHEQRGDAEQAAQRRAQLHGGEEDGARGADVAGRLRLLADDRLRGHEAASVSPSLCTLSARARPQRRSPA